MKSLLGNSRRPDISFHKNGRIDITARVAKKLNLQTGDVIDVAFDGVEYYLYIQHKSNELIGKHESQCFPTKRGSNNFRAYSARLCRNIIDLSDAEDVVRLPVGEYEERNGYPSVVLIACNNLSDREYLSNSQIPISYDEGD